jgi:hypothetical protein
MRFSQVHLSFCPHKIVMVLNHAEAGGEFNSRILKLLTTASSLILLDSSYTLFHCVCHLTVAPAFIRS